MSRWIALRCLVTAFKLFFVYFVVGNVIIYNVDSELIQIGVYLANCRPEMEEERFPSFIHIDRFHVTSSLSKI